MNLNKVMLIGNLTRAPEMRTTQTGKNVARFALATNQVWKDDTGAKKERPEFHNIVAWGRLAEICSQYLGKGKKVYIEGRLRTSDWQGQDGVKRYRTEVIAENLIMLDRAGGPAQSEPIEQSPSEAPADEEIKVEEVPF